MQTKKISNQQKSKIGKFRSKLVERIKISIKKHNNNVQIENANSMVGRVIWQKKKQMNRHEMYRHFSSRIDNIIRSWRSLLNSISLALSFALCTISITVSFVLSLLSPVLYFVLPFLAYFHDKWVCLPFTYWIVPCDMTFSNENLFIAIFFCFVFHSFGGLIRVWMICWILFFSFCFWFSVC